MSRQGFLQQTPPLFLTQGQYTQLERSFTDPLQRQIEALRLQYTYLEADRDQWKSTAEEQQGQIQEYEEQIAALQANQWPDTVEPVRENRTFNTNVILWFSWEGGAAEETEIVRYFDTENQREEGITMPAGTESALIIWNYTTGQIDIYGDSYRHYAPKYGYEVTALYNIMNIWRVMAFY